MVGRHRSAILVGVAVAGLVLSACGSGSGSNSGGSGGSKSAYLVGATEDLSGALAVYGKWAQESLTGYFNYVNAHGGINGHQVTVKILDDASDPSRAATNVRQLTSEKALVVSGSTLSNICAAIEPMTTQAKVAEMCTAVPQNMFKPVHPYVFARLMPAETLADPIIAFVPKIITAPKPRVAIITTTAADAVAFGKRTQQEAEAQGWTVVANKQVVASENANITGPAAAIATAKADVVIGELAGPNNVTFIRQLRSAGSNAPFISETADYGSMV
ncbi:MAG: hypothetical protein QOE61_4408, partial [Micromonosporaceae bacterium]|nr:hypothetical protein [Micromonosporaceae bacterium]